MVKSKPDTIVLKGKPIIKERTAEAKINPGYLVELVANNKVKAQGTAKEDCAGNFAIENGPMAKEITEEYAQDELVYYGCFHSGQEVYAKVAAAAVAIVIGDTLEAKGDGTVTKLTDGAVMGFALEAIDNSAGANEVFIKMEVK